MELRIADTFVDSLARLSADEQKQAKTTAFDLQLNPASPGHGFHRLDRARDKHFWSVRVGSDLRLIVHRSATSLLLCYVDHHDKAYAWAERRKLETHPATGAAQWIEIRETVQEIPAPTPARPSATSASAAAPLLFERVSDDELLRYGVPPEWLADVRHASEDSLLALADHLPAEAAEALLELATGGKPRLPAPATAEAFDHPDAQRRFRVMGSLAELQRALDAPWEKWMVFLHPEQRQWVERDYNGPARVSGSAGTGKTIVALHRAAHLARANPDARVLLATHSDPLAHALQFRLNRLLAHEPRLAERIDVHALDAIGRRLYQSRIGPLRLASDDDIRSLVAEAAQAVPEHRFGLAFLLGEWWQVVDAWQLDDWPAYRDVARLGRRSRLSEAQRAQLWAIFGRVRAGLEASGRITVSRLFTALAQALTGEARPVFDFAVIDEAQDVGIAQLRFLVALAGGAGRVRPNALFFAGDPGQRIFQQPFSWKSLGVDIRGRSRTLRVNYRTSHQIRSQADRLLGPDVRDADGNVDMRNDTVSVFNGPAPQVQVFDAAEVESAAVGRWLAGCIGDGIEAHEIGVFVRAADQIGRAEAAVRNAGLGWRILDGQGAPESGQVAVGTMHLAKGLEFRAVAVMACDDEILPLQARLETVGDDGDLQEAYDSERQLLYVACTRARDRLLVSATAPASEFLDDLQGK